MTTDLKLASRLTRLFAFLIDHLSLTLVIVLPLLLLLTNDDTPDNTDIFFLFPVFIIVSMLFYFCKDFIKGASLGKWLLGLTVREQKNLDSTPSLMNLFLRNLTIVIWPVELIVLLVDKNKRRLGDKLGKTVVVQSQKVSVLKIILIILLGFILFTFIIFATVMYVIKSSDAYQISESFIEQNEEIKQKTGGVSGFGFLPSGTINITDESGESFLTLKVKGKVKDIVVDIYLTKQPGSKWIVKEYHY